MSPRVRPTLRLAALRGGAVAVATALLYAGLTSPGHPAPPGLDTGERYTSPVEKTVFRVLRDDATGEKWFEADDGTRFEDVPSIQNAECARLTPLERTIAQALRDRIRRAEDAPRADGEEPETVAVILRFARQPASEAAEAAWTAHGDRLTGLQARVRSFFDLLAERREPGVAPATDDEARLLSAEERDAFASARDAVREEIRRIRREVIDAARPLAFADQEPVVERLLATPGARVLGRSFLLSTVSVRMPVTDLTALAEDHPEIARIEPMGVRSPTLDVSVPTIGADTWWNAGYDGSTATKVAILDTGVDSSHPALDGIVSDESVHIDAATQDPSFDDDETSPDDFHLHGTHVAGIVASNDDTYTGVAPGVSVMNAKCGFNTTDGGGGFYDSDVFEAGDWAASNGADVFNCSFGGQDSTDGSTAITLFMDSVVDDLGIAVAIAAGNAGSSSGTIGVPSDGFNIICVGNFDDRGSTSWSDDRLTASSSRGPLDDGRRKPDFSAPGTNIRSCFAFWESSSDFIDLTGTSMASPHVAGSLGLLMNAGVASRPDGLKALLMTNLRNTSPVSTSPDDDWGWGAIDLDAAYTNRAAVFEGKLTSSGVGTVLLRPGSLATGDRVTLAWSRRVVSNGTSAPSTYSALLDLDLSVWDESSGSSIGASASGLNSVEQVKTTGSSTSPIIAVNRAKSFPSGLSTQWFAVGAESASTISEIAPPQMACTFTSLPSQIGPFMQFSVTAEAKNSGGLTAQACAVSLSLPAGYSLVSGSNPQTLGKLAPSATAEASWTVRSAATGNGPRELVAVASSNSYGGTFAGRSADGNHVLDTDAPTGSVVIQDGAAASTSPTVKLTLSATDTLTGVADMRYRTSGDAWGDWVPYAATATTSLSGADGTKTVEVQFRDGVGNVSMNATDSILLDTAAPTGSITIAGGADWTASLDVDLAFSASDATSSVTHLRISDDGGASWTPWTTFAASASWRLSGADGKKSLSAQFRDSAGNLSDPVSDEIGLDSVAPTGAVSVAGGAAATNAVEAPVSLTWSDAASGVKEMRFTLDGATWSAWEPVQTPTLRPLPAADGTAVVGAQLRDAAGNVSAVAADDILVDRTPPAGTFVLEGGAAYLAPGVVLHADVDAADTEGGAGVDAFRWSHDGGATWSPWVALGAGRVQIDVADVHDAADVVTGQFRDAAGNVSAPASDSIHVLASRPQDASAAKRVDGAIDRGGDVDSYRLELQGGDRLDARVALIGARRLDVAVETDLFGPDGTLLVAGRHPAGGRAAGIHKFLAPETGTYRLVLRATGFDAPNGVRYKLLTTVRPVRVPPAVGTGTGPGFRVDFSSAANRTLRGSVWGLSAPSAALHGPDGTDLQLALRLRRAGRMDLPNVVLFQGSGAYSLTGAADEGAGLRWSIRIGPPRRAKKAAEDLSAASR